MRKYAKISPRCVQFCALVAIIAYTLVADAVVVSATCGDGHVNGLEICDDGNIFNDDGWTVLVFPQDSGLMQWVRGNCAPSPRARQMRSVVSPQETVPGCVAVANLSWSFPLFAASGLKPQRCRAPSSSPGGAEQLRCLCVRRYTPKRFCVWYGVTVYWQRGEIKR